MGRHTSRTSPLDDSPVAVSGGKFSTEFLQIDAAAMSGLSFSTATVSATQTATILGLTGPGVLNYFSINTRYGPGYNLELRLVIDDEVCYSATYSTAEAVLVGFRYPSGNNNPYSFIMLDPVPFAHSAVVTIRGPYGGLRIDTAAHWRLTDG